MPDSSRSRDANFIRQLADIVGEPYVLTRPEEVAPYVRDWRRRYTGTAKCVVRPANTGQVSQAVALCASEGVAIVPQGGNTGLSGGSVPVGRGEVVLSLARMNRIRDLDISNNTITAEAGCVLAQVQDAARNADRLFPVSLAAEGSCQIGGNLSTNAGGVNVLRYGNMREQVLGLEVVLPDARVWDGLRALRKDNTGYDMKHLFIGAEGTLGVITAAVLRLQPLPSASVTAWAALTSAHDAVAWLADLKARVGERLSTYELISRPCVAAVLRYAAEARDPLPTPHAWYVLAELTDVGPREPLRQLAEAAFAQALERRLIRDVALAETQAQSSALWKIRETIPEAQFRNVKHDISVPVSNVPAFLERAGEALEAAYPGVVPYAFGHLGDGNIHYNVGMPEEEATERLVSEGGRVNEIVFEVVASLAGSISAEHGVGQLRRDALTRYKSDVELDLMRRVKQALDPRGIMNPGKVL